MKKENTGSKSEKEVKWAMLNKIMNGVRKAKGVELVNPKDNPYRAGLKGASYNYDI